MTDDDRLVRDYLRQLRRATRGLPRSRRQELLSEIAGHIAEARASGAATGPSGPAVTGTRPARPEEVPAILARLGEPADIARAAGGPQLASRAGGLEIAAVTLLLVGGFAVVIGWLVGCVLLWVSPRWRWTDKLLGTLIWPGGLAAPFFLGSMAFSAQGQTCTGGSPGMPATCTPPNPGPPAWLGIGLLVLLVAGPVLMAVWLLHRARRLPDQPAASQDMAVPVR